MLRLVFTSSKFCTLVVGVITIPLIIELPLVLRLWLTNIPEYALEFTQLILISSLIGQISAGLIAGLLAMGRIKVYQIVVSTLMLLNLPLAYIFLKLGFAPPWILVGMIFCEILSLIGRLIFVQQLCRMSINQFFRRVILPLLLILGLDWIILMGITNVMDTSFIRLVLNSVLSVIIVGGLAWFILLNQMEKNALLQFVKRFTQKIKR